MKRVVFLLLVSVFMVGAHLAEAQSGRAVDASEVAKFVNGIINESVNANTLFASQESIATGRFTQRQSSQPDKDYSTIRLPGEIALGEVEDSVRPIFLGNAAYLRSTAGYNPVDGIGEADFTSTSLFALSAGSGAFVKLSDSVTLAPVFSLTYSHIKNHFDFNNPFSQTYLQVFTKELFNWNMDVLTYIPALKLFYQSETGIGKFNYQISYSYLFNDSIRDNSSMLNINSSTGLCSNRFDLLIPTNMNVESTELFVRPMFQWNNISGSAVAGLGLRDLFEIGADLVAGVLDKEAWLTTITFGASYVTGDNFEGYHLGAGVTF